MPVPSKIIERHRLAMSYSSLPAMNGLLKGI